MLLFCTVGLSRQILFAAVLVSEVIYLRINLIPVIYPKDVHRIFHISFNISNKFLYLGT